MKKKMSFLESINYEYGESRFFTKVILYQTYKNIYLHINPEPKNKHSKINNIYKIKTLRLKQTYNCIIKDRKYLKNV